ncbi:MAG: transporter [Flavobacteriia bacterium]|nr:transporter [Flavobacteriia bacterium]
MPKLKPSNYQAFLSVLTLMVFIFTQTQSLAQYTDIINSNQPGNSMSAYAVGTGVYQIESHFYVDRVRIEEFQSNTFFNTTALNLRMGLLSDRLELVYETAYTIEFTSSPVPGQPVGVFNGLISNRLGVKYMLYDPFRNPKNRPINVRSWNANNKFRLKNLLPAIAIYTGANIGLQGSIYLKEHPSISPKFMLISQSTLTPKMVLILNGSYNFIGDEVLEEKTLIASLSYSFKPKWSLFIEGQQSEFIQYKEQQLRAGAAYLFTKNMQLHVFGGVNFQDKTNKEMIAAGFSFRIDNHKIK